MKAKLKNRTLGNRGCATPQLEENLGALSIELEEEDRRQMDEASSKINI